MTTPNNNLSPKPEVMSKLNQALLSAFGTRPQKLPIIVGNCRQALTFVNEGDSPENQIFAIIREAASEGWFDCLVKEAYEENPGNPELKEFVKNYYPDLLEKLEPNPPNKDYWSNRWKNIRESFSIFIREFNKNILYPIVSGILLVILTLIIKAKFPECFSQEAKFPECFSQADQAATHTPTPSYIDIPLELAIVFVGKDENGVCYDQLCGINLIKGNDDQNLMKFESTFDVGLEDESKIKPADLEFSNDGSKLAVNIDTELWIFGFDNKDHIEDINTGKFPTYDWSPNGDRIAYVKSDSGSNEKTLYVVSIDWRENPSNKLIDFIVGGGKWLVYPTWSPNENVLALSGTLSNREPQEIIFTIEAETKNVRWFKTANDLDHCQDFSSVYWSEEGSKIAVACSWGRNVALKVAWYEDHDGGSSFVPLFERQGGMIQSLAWSPDASRIAFVYKKSEDMSKRDAEIYIMDVPNASMETEKGSLIQVGQGFRSVPELVWRKETEDKESEGLLAFADQGPDQAHIYKIKEDSSIPEVVASHTATPYTCIEKLQWSPGGTKLIYSVGQSKESNCFYPENQNVIWVDWVDETRTENLTNSLSSYTNKYSLIAWLYGE